METKPSLLSAPGMLPRVGSSLSAAADVPSRTRCHCRCWRRARRGHPLRSRLRVHGKLGLSSDTDLDADPPRVRVFTNRILTFLFVFLLLFFFTLMSLKNGFLQRVREDETLVGRARLRGREKRKTSGRPSRLLALCGVPNTSGGCWSVSPLFSFAQPSKRTPFCGGSEDGRRRWDGRVGPRRALATPTGEEV